jgi:iron(III) transport system ATP-binding protein
VIEVEGLSKSFSANGQGIAAVAGIGFEIKAGEMATLLGPSGCGKTTTLRCLAGLERPDSGRIAIGERTVVDAKAGIFVPPQRRNLGMVFQSYAIWPHMTVLENVAYALEGRGIG